MTTHELKAWPELFSGLINGTKTADVRSYSDRAFSVGDVIISREFDPKTGEYSGRIQERKIARVDDLYALTGLKLALLSFENVGAETAAEKRAAKDYGRQQIRERAHRRARRM